jgi:hypothetical protein
MRRSVPGFLVLVVTLALAIPASFVAAQQATPDAEPGSVATVIPGGASPKIGDTVSYIGESGSEIATLTVLRQVRPWEEYDDFYEPESGTEYVAFEIEVTHLGRRGDLIIRSYDLRLQDIDGFFLSEAWVDAAADAELAPAEDDVVVASGETETVVVVFQVIEGIELSHLYWLPEYDRLITLADLSEE